MTGSILSTRMALAQYIPHEIVNAAIAQQKIITNLMYIFDLSETDTVSKFNNWMKTKPFTSRIGYKKILAGDFSFLN